MFIAFMNIENLCLALAVLRYSYLALNGLCWRYTISLVLILFSI